MTTGTIFIRSQGVTVRPLRVLGGLCHPGIDFALLNDSNVIAAVPGQVIDIMVQDYGESVENRFMIHVVIRFNISLTVDYAFEPWTNITANKDHQMELLDIVEGQWVQKGDKIATFLKAGISAHIHFMVHENMEVECPCKYLGAADYIEIMEMIHSFQPTWWISVIIKFNSLLFDILVCPFRIRT